MTPKHACLYKGVVSGSDTSLYKLIVVLLAYITHTPEEAAATMFEEDLAYTQGLLEVDKIKFSLTPLTILIE